MNQFLTSEFSRDDLEHPIEIAERVWWVGNVLENDDFQCHVYLIENGDQSVLIDPGGSLSWDIVRKKVEAVIDFNQIRYFICHHQDPDITASLLQIDNLVQRPDATIVSHWRAIALLKHYGLKNLSFICVEKEGWSLGVGRGRRLEFIFTPYLHFPGAFCTFDWETGILFSSDLFGGFTKDWSLVAKDESYFEAIRPFHEHYMPSQELLYRGLVKIEAYPLRMIAPQHGSILPRDIARFVINRLKTIDCGIYTLAQESTDVRHLADLNQMLRSFMEVMVLHRGFHEIAMQLTSHVKGALPVTEIAFYAQNEIPDDVTRTLCWLPSTRHHPHEGALPEWLVPLVGISRKDWLDSYGGDVVDSVGLDREAPTSLVMPLFSQGEDKARAFALLFLDHAVELSAETERALTRIANMLSIAVEREVLYLSIDRERQRFYEQSIRDGLTGLYNRFFMRDSVSRLFEINDREPSARIAVLMLDIDHFKNINDRFGHGIGDAVLKSVAKVIMTVVRQGDIPVRYGGEEFAIVLPHIDAAQARNVAERMLMSIESLKPRELQGEFVTASCGLAMRAPNESMDSVLSRADLALYSAKEGGRNRVCVSGSPN